MLKAAPYIVLLLVACHVIIILHRMEISLNSSVHFHAKESSCNFISSYSRSRFVCELVIHLAQYPARYPTYSIPTGTNREL